MRTTLQVFWYATLVLVSSAPMVAGDEPSLVPKRFSAQIGGFRAHSYSVELRDGTLNYTSFGPGRSNPQHTVITPTEAQWREFRQALDDLKVWQWRAEYHNTGTLDGTGWSLDVAYADRTINTSGYNAYPDATGEPYFQGSPTNAFKRYLAAIKKLIGGLNFE